MKIRSKIISEVIKENFEYAMNEFLEEKYHYSIQYRPVRVSDGKILFTALVTYQVEEEEDE